MNTSAENLDKALGEVLTKIESQSLTCEDLDSFMRKAMIVETTPESVRDRIRRRTKRNETDSHIEPETGHQPLDTPTFKARTAPKRAPVNQQSHGRADIGHAHSTRTQIRNARLAPALEFIVANHKKPITEDLIKNAPPHMGVVIGKLMVDNKFDRDWLNQLAQKVR